ncbi:HesB/IscA family protein [Methylophaga sp. OBS1]|jgi:iron-sulfur cluster assembly protein|uniref:HesB/IscA family protein n=1 Tax=Methylophaga sp. OBS1 TaxID=2991933 RepID=UPI0019A404ED|nr:iron-sulfur cluster assembly accessory protein [Methylophaga sp.]MED5510216.1 iron-sulfur cluster assembly accessory protein [Pseudomonadota bacterium]
MITLTESAIKRVRDMMSKREGGVGLRVGVVKSGCSGYSYALDYADEVASDDVVIEQGDVKVVVNEDAMPMLEGMELDFVREGLNQSFKFINPNVTSECGCGESFSVTK